jgi:hypothetical protein
MSKKIFSRRELYAPGHFGNTYEVAGRFEMREILSEAKWWGFNWYGDWFDTVNLTKESHLHKPEGISQCWLTKAIWENKKIHFEEAQRLGFNLDFLISPNHVFADQTRKELLAKDAPRVSGHILCPSTLEGREIILENYDQWFKDLAKSNISLNSITAAPYDFGGCGGEECDPWILTFAKLSKEIHENAIKYFPEVEMRFCSWWVDSKEHDLFADWVDKNAFGWAKGMSLWIKYSEDKPSSVPPGRLPKGCKEDFFVHIGYSDKQEERDLYGEWGPTLAPNRIPKTLDSLKNVNGEGFMAYSEGIFDDVNKALLAGLSSGKFSSSEEVLEVYAERYLNGNNKNKKEWAEWLFQWGDPFAADLKKARANFNRLAADAPDTWRLKQLASKLRLFELNKEINEENTWSPNRLAKVEEFFREKENLKRKIYGLSPLHEPVFATIVGYPSWYENWYKHTSPITPFISGRKISSEA